MAMATTTALAIGSMVMAATSAAYSITSTNAAASKAQQQAAQNAQAAYVEYDRQQGEANRIAAEQKSDRIRQANQELGTLRASDSFGGIADSGFMALVRETGYVEGLDLSRIEGNRQNTLDSIQSKKEAAQLGSIEQADAAAMMAKTNTVKQGLGVMGSALQIGSAYSSHQDTLEALRNKTP